MQVRLLKNNTALLQQRQNQKKHISFSSYENDRFENSTSAKITATAAVMGGVMGIGALQLGARVIGRSAISLALVPLKRVNTIAKQHIFVKSMDRFMMKTPAKYAAIALGALMGAGMGWQSIKNAVNVKNQSN